MTEAARRLFDDRIREGGGTVERALAEVIQYITLLGLSRTDLFTTAAFYGGTVLRMLHGLGRFSAGLDVRRTFGRQLSRLSSRRTPGRILSWSEHLSVSVRCRLLLNSRRSGSR